MVSKVAFLPRAETRGGIKDGDSSKRGQKHVAVSKKRGRKHVLILKMATPVKEGRNTWWYQRWRLQ
jgi:hypothetical protein